MRNRGPNRRSRKQLKMLARGLRRMSAASDRFAASTVSMRQAFRDVGNGMGPLTSRIDLLLKDESGGWKRYVDLKQVVDNPEPIWTALVPPAMSFYDTMMGQPFGVLEEVPQPIIPGQSFVEALRKLDAGGES